MDRYTARINLHGTTQRERMVNRTKANLQNKVVDSLSYKTIKLNGIETQLVINEGTQSYYKEFESMPGQEINIGDYIEWANSWWLVTTCDYDDELYRNGKLQQCNYLLKWQNELGEIIERQAVVLSASKYNDGLAESNVISLGSDKLSINIPLDAEALKLKKSMAKKFFIDNNKEDPTAYLLANTGNVADTYNGHGITHWIVEECAYTASEDDLKYGVCDYISPTTPPEEDDKTTILSGTITGTISGNKNLKVGFSRTYTANLVDEDGNAVEWSDEFKWNIVGDIEANLTENGNQIELLVEDEDLIDETCVLQVVETEDNSVITEITFTVIGSF
jgi:hypothetical protein